MHAFRRRRPGSPRVVPVWSFVFCVGLLMDGALAGCSDTEGSVGDDDVTDETTVSPGPTTPTPILEPEVTPPPSPTPETWEPPIDYGPVVDTVSITDWEEHVRQLSGDEPITLGDEAITLNTRYAYTDKSEEAAYFLQSELTTYGYNVALQPFTFSGHSAYNVVATAQGTDPSRPKIVVGAHYDSISNDPYEDAPGADDNASGTATVLEVARVLSDYRFESTVDFVLFGAEELGLYGSTAYVADAKANGTPIEGAIILDMVGFYESVFGVTLETDVRYTDWSGVADDAIDDWTDLSTTLSVHPFGSDHVPFIEAGIPAYLIIETEWEDSPFHTPDDTYANIHADLGYEVTEAVVATVLESARVVAP